MKTAPTWNSGTVASQGALTRHLGELVRARDLIYQFVIRDLKARYKSSVLGFLWSLLNPLGMMLVFTLVFTVLMPNNQMANYPIFLLAGLLPWNFFSASVMTGTNSIVASGGLVKKVYFPREVLPIASVLANLVNFLLALIVLFAAMIIFRLHFSPYLWMLPVVILLQTAFTLGMVFILSTLNVFYRDTLMVLDVGMLAWFFLTPVFYPISLIPEHYQVLGVVIDVRRWMYILNPMASLTAAYRDIVYWGAYTNLDFFIRTSLTALIVLAFGYWFFIRYSSRFGEEV